VVEGNQAGQKVALNGGLFKGTVTGSSDGRLTGAHSESRVDGKCKYPGEKQELSKGGTKEGKRKDTLKRSVYTSPGSRTKSA
jgi:hypothetical protein